MRDKEVGMPEAVKGEISVAFHTYLFATRPGIAVYMANIMNSWAILESQLISLFISAHNKCGEGDVDKFVSTNAMPLRMDKLRILVEKSFSAEFLLKVDNLKPLIEESARGRNRIVHSRWATSDLNEQEIVRFPHYAEAKLNKHREIWRESDFIDVLSMLNRTNLILDELVYEAHTV